MDPVVLDTDVASLRFKGELPTPLFARLVGRRPLITFVTHAELTKWMALRGWGATRRARLANWLAATAVLPLATLNVKDFVDFAEYDGLNLITG